MGRYHQGKFFPKKPEKYSGDLNDIVYRSSWEILVFRWCDLNPDVTSWSSESVIIPYRCMTDGKPHRYFVDLKIVFKNRATILVEIKPDSQVREPKAPKRKSNKYIKEALTYTKNVSKWRAANEFCEDRGWTFQIWTENTIRAMGIKII